MVKELLGEGQSSDHGKRKRKKQLVGDRLQTVSHALLTQLPILDS